VWTEQNVTEGITTHRNLTEQWSQSFSQVPICSYLFSHIMLCSPSFSRVLIRSYLFNPILLCSPRFLSIQFCSVDHCSVRFLSLLILWVPFYSVHPHSLLQSVESHSLTLVQSRFYPILPTKYFSSIWKLTSLRDDVVICLNSVSVIPHKNIWCPLFGKVSKCPYLLSGILYCLPSFSYIHKITESSFCR